MGKKNEETPIEQTPEIKQTEKKPEKKQSARKNAENGRLPALLEIVFDTSKILILFIPLIVAAVSYSSGATWPNIVIRTGVTLLAVGILSLSITRRIVNASIEVTNEMLEKAADTESTIEREA